MKRLKKLLQAIKFNLLPNQNRKIIQKRILGQKINVIDGTIRNEDYDDTWFLYLAKHSPIIFDIGSNVGYNAIMANLTGKVKRNVLVDPNPQALSDAAHNLLLNNLIQNCSFFPAFVADKNDKKIKFYTVSSGAAGSMYKSTAETAAILDSYIMVNSVTIDTIVEYYQLIPDLVKIDVEGAEHLALQGAKKLAGFNKSRFIVEMHAPPELPMKENAQMILSWCTENQFDAWYLKEGNKLTDAQQIAHRGKCHLLLQPSGWDYPDFLLGIAEKAPLPDHI